jgi:site-specific recombinase XerD
MRKFANSGFYGLIHDYLKLYLPKQRKLSSNTIRSYKQTLDYLTGYVKTKKKIQLGDGTFEILDAEMIIEYLDYAEETLGCSVSTRNQRLAAIRAFLKFAADRDVTTVVILNELKKVPVKKPNKIDVIGYMTMEAVSAIVAQTDASTPKGLRDCVFMILMYDTGARLQEMIDIKLRDIRLSKTSTITLHGKGGKLRSVPLMQNTVEYLKIYLDHFHSSSSPVSDLPLFYSTISGDVKPISCSCVRLFLSQYANKAREICKEVPVNVHPHLWRHSRAMHLYQNGMDLTLVQE